LVARLIAQIEWAVQSLPRCDGAAVEVFERLPARELEDRSPLRR
jgi:hypothetical protein